MIYHSRILCLALLLVTLSFKTDGFTATFRSEKPRVREMERVHSTLSMVSGAAESTKTTTSSRPESKYPTARGSEVDSRKIVRWGGNFLEAVRLNHVLFASKDLASQSLAKLRSAEITFDELALQISNCAETREKKGEIGWVSTSESENEHLDLIMSPDARTDVLQRTTKVRNPFFSSVLATSIVTDFGPK